MGHVSRSGEETERREAIANAFLAFAAMMEKDYGVSKAAAVLSIQAAYDVNQDRAPLVSGVPMRSLKAEEEAIRRAPIYGPTTALSERRSTNAAPQDSGRVGASQSHDPAVAAPESSERATVESTVRRHLCRKLRHYAVGPYPHDLQIALGDAATMIEDAPASAISAHEAVLKCAELVDGHDRVIALRMIRDFAATLSAIAEGRDA